MHKSCVYVRKVHGYVNTFFPPLFLYPCPKVLGGEPKGMSPFHHTTWLGSSLLNVALCALMVISIRSIDGLPARFNASEYAGIHSRLPAIIKERVSGKHCGNWYVPYSQMQAATRAANSAAASDDIGYWSIANAASSATFQPARSRYTVMRSSESGLGDRLGCSLTVFLHALLSNRAFEYEWYGHHVLWDSYQSFWIDWRVPPESADEGVIMRAEDGTVLPVVTENHFWKDPNRSRQISNFYLSGYQLAERHLMTQLFTSGDISTYGDDKDVVIWKLNTGLLMKAFSNPQHARRLQELGLTWQYAVPCIFNYLFVPSPEALAPFRAGELLQKLLDPENFVIGIQIRLGDWVFKTGGGDLNHGAGHFACAQQLTDEITRTYNLGNNNNPAAESASSTTGAPTSPAAVAPTSPAVAPTSPAVAPTWLEKADANLNAMFNSRWVKAGRRSLGPLQEQPQQEQQHQQQQLGRRQLRQEQQQPADPPAPAPKNVYWFLISDSAALRRAAMQKYGSEGKLLVAESVPLDHVQDFPQHKQLGLHVAAGEVWLFGQASAHIITTASAFGRLGALGAGPRPPLPGGPEGTSTSSYRIFGVPGGGFRGTCSLSRPDSLETVAGWYIGMRSD
ncbi:hypothetical protein Agub_g13533 [Astrephomene gubernaculifera]|uniref:Uncharacterized protein n=1 Tax=Astrephomene gubernaculifera TaxID=47775 RepID=A0AAD3DZZ9_9CHLO|nr:hypothetical protein Agub_g13533 [Astrephomene gubernaculifera]